MTGSCYGTGSGRSCRDVNGRRRHSDLRKAEGSQGPSGLGHGRGRVILLVSPVTRRPPVHSPRALDDAALHMAGPPPPGPSPRQPTPESAPWCSPSSTGTPATPSRSGSSALSVRDAPTVSLDSPALTASTSPDRVPPATPNHQTPLRSGLASRAGPGHQRLPDHAGRGRRRCATTA